MERVHGKVLRWFTAAALIVPAVLDAQQRSVSGRVLEEGTNAPISDVQIVARGGTAAALSRDNGGFTITLPTASVILDVRRIGYKPQNVTVPPGMTTLTIVLSKDILRLDEMVVTGTAGEQTRRSQPAQVAVLNAAELIRTAPKAAVADVLQSSLPGVSVTQGSGTTGSAQRIRIRGASSISLSNEPLVFIDGVRADARISGVNRPGEGSGSGTGTGGQATSRLNDINPEDIESIEVVKGPAAATLYGADASAGVVQIITKRGRSGSFQQNVVAEHDVLDANFSPPDNWAVCTQTEINNNTPACQGKSPGTLISDNPLLRERVLKDGRNQQLSWSGSGGSENFRVFASLSDLSERGVLPASEMERNTARVNTRWSLRPNLNLNVGYGVIGSYSRQPDNNHSLYGYGANAMSGTPLSLGLANNGWLSTRRSKDIAAIKNTIRLIRNTPSVELSHQPSGWFNHRLVVGADFSNEEKLRLIPKNDLNLYRNEHNPGLVRETRSNFRYVTLDYLGRVAQSFGADQRWDQELAFGVQTVVNRSDYVWADGSGLATNSAHVVSAAAQTAGGQQFLEERSIGYLGQYQIGYRKRAFFQVGLRMDRNSSFGEDVPAFYLPKVGGSWVISEEPFFQERVPQINTLRLRAAYGATGRAPRPGSAAESWRPSPFAASATSVGPGLELLNPGNPDLRPERGTEFEAGLDAGLFNSRIGLELTFFRKLTRDLILQQQLPSSVGYIQDPFVNLGKVLNRGIEASINAQVFSGSRHSWDVRLSMNTLHNELLDLGGLPPFGQFERFVEGRPLSAWFTPTVKSVDVARNVAIVSDTLEYVGGKLPTREATFFSNLTLYRNLRITAQLDMKQGFKINNNTKQYRDQQVVRNREALDPNFLSPEARLRRFGPFVNESGAKISAAQVWESYFEDGDFVRLREVSVTYNVPRSLSQRVRAGNATIAIGGRNLALWTDYSGFDPEAISNNAAEDVAAFGQYEFFNLPPSKRFFVRLTVDF